MEGPLGNDDHESIPYVSLDDEVEKNEKIERAKSESVPKQVRLDEEFEEEEDDFEGSGDEERAEGGSARFRRERRARSRRRKGGSRMSRSASMEPPKDLESRHQALNQLGFGFKPFVNHVAKKPLDLRSDATRELYLKPSLKKEVSSDSFLSFGNLLWVICFGWWLSLLYVILSGLLFITVVGIPYAKLCWQLKSYFFWPFGKFIIRSEVDDSEELPLKRTKAEDSGVYRNQGRSKAARVVSAVIWYIFAVPILVCAHAWTWLWCWELVITIPMAKINSTALKLLFNNPLQLSVTMAYPRASANVVLFTFQSINFYYVRYTVSGMNIMIVNLFPFVLLTLALGFLIPEAHRPNEVVLFFFALVSIVPLAYYIGMAVSSISAQSSLALGAVLNASFGSIVELILYWTAIMKGQLGNFVQASITGSLLCTMLLIPGASMVAGGIKHQEQRFNQISAGVSSVLLIFSLVGAFIPTVFYSAFGSYSLDCSSCLSVANITAEGLTCTGCTYAEVTLAEDRAYTHGAKPLMYAVSIVLPLAYLIGLFFTLKTHAAYILKEAPKEEKAGGHDSPEWNKVFCVVVLIVCTALFAGISELLSQSVEHFQGTGLTQEFVGVALVGVFGNAAELINAVSFGLRNNIALSLEIGNAGTIQTALIQIPGLVLFSAILNSGNPHGSFILIFPSLDLFALIFSALILNYISINGKTNYFEGTALLLVYAVSILSFYFVPENAVSPENST